MSVNVAGHLAKNKIVKDMQGNIIDLYDESQGGWIVQKRAIVNQEAWQRLVQREKDKIEAAKAVTMAKIRDDYPETKEGTNSSTGKVDELEKKVNAMDDKLEQILKALQK